MTTTLLTVPYPYTEAGLTNLALNPSVETDATYWGYSVGIGGTASGARMGPYLSGEHAPLGAPSAYFWRASWTVATTTIGGGINYSQTIYVIPGQPYSAILSYRCSKAQRLRLDFSWRTAANVGIGGDVGAEFVATPNAWAQVSLENKVAPVGAARLVVTLYAVAGTGATNWAPSDSLDGDNLRITTAALIAPGYFDGSFSSAGLIGQRYAWDGTAHASVSRLTTRTPTAAATKVTPELVTEYGAQRASGTVLHDVIGRPDPVPALAPLRTSTGTLTVWCSTLAKAQSVVALYALGRVVLLRDPASPEMDMYHVATSTRLSPASLETNPPRWSVDVEYAEVYSTVSLW